MDRAAGLAKDALVWDNVWPLEPWAGNDWDKLPVLAAAGWNLISLTIAGDDQNLGQAFARVAAAHKRILSDPSLVLVEKADDVLAAKAAGKLAVTLHFEGTNCFERDLSVIEPFFRLGVRHTLLAFNVSNSAGGGCAEASDGGLTKWGRSLIAEMERVGMMLDLSHVGLRTSLEAMEAATRPVLFTHSNAASVQPHYRNLTDLQIKACAATGGLVGISGSSDYLGDLNASTEALFRHVDHVVRLVGIDHVGLGLDLVFDAEAVTNFARSRADEWPQARDPNWPGFRYAQPAQLVDLVALMLERGYGDEDVRKFLGGNYLRLARTFWR
ncbi:MAG: membrane dipeptidase [Rhodospirillaceae bacterium]|nr:membrane dipeptidase [Rhodospirillaceae bacterium]